MPIGGWETRSVFDRYNIVNDQDLREAALKQQSFIEFQDGCNLVTIEEPAKSNVVNLQG